MGSIPGGGAKIPCALNLTCLEAKNQSKIRSSSNKFSKDLKNGPHQNILKKRKKSLVKGWSLALRAALPLPSCVAKRNQHFLESQLLLLYNRANDTYPCPQIPMRI